MFKIKGNFPELDASDAQNAVKIVAVIFPVVCNKSNLRTNFLFAQIHVRNPHLSALKCSNRVRHFFCSQFATELFPRWKEDRL
jgi:hypothetical protein